MHESCQARSIQYDFPSNASSRDYTLPSYNDLFPFSKSPYVQMNWDIEHSSSRHGRRGHWRVHHSLRGRSAQSEAGSAQRLKIRIRESCDDCGVGWQTERGTCHTCVSKIIAVHVNVHGSLLQLHRTSYLLLDKNSQNTNLLNKSSDQPKIKVLPWDLCRSSSHPWFPWRDLRHRSRSPKTGWCRCRRDRSCG